MQRALCRILRNSCSKLRDNENSPILAAEELHQKNKNKENCKPPPGYYTVGEAIGWTTSLVLTYEFVHRRRKRFGQDDGNGGGCSLSSSSTTYTSFWTSYLKCCPFGLGRLAASQPIIGVGIQTTARNIQATSNDRSSLSSPSSSPLSKSIDTTPFLKENDSLFFPTTFRSLSPSLIRQNSVSDDEDDDGIQFDASITKFDEAKSSRPPNNTIVSFTEKFIGDIYSTLGSLKFLASKSQKPDNQYSNLKALNAADSVGILIKPMELLEKGVSLGGSGRAYYNIGVAYDRMNDAKLAREYYQKAADVGHVLGSYNTAVFLFKDGKVFEGLRLMTFAAENGVDEAKEILNLIIQFRE